MAEYLSEFVTNLAMPPAVRPVPHQFAMGDNNAYTFTALLCDARNPDAELMAGTVSGSLLRPDGTTVALGGTKGAAVRRVNLDGGGMCNATPCSVTLPQACFAYPGRVTLVITLVDGTTSPRPWRSPPWWPGPAPTRWWTLATWCPTWTSCRPSPPSSRRPWAAR